MTPDQRPNMARLAAHLMALPADYREFDMKQWSEERPQRTTCGTVACAAGHGPMAGIRALPGEEWYGYVSRVFTDDLYERRWCFGADWTDIDNTPHGAARRIRHLLDHGLPADWWEQMYREAPYMFAEDAR